ncbi:YncE family protein [Falsigemmobacter intermedius]|uniref:YncE family protein n=1 Tax=Falsigemmobacter intermedius TaxID=1553448 RepID=A0A444MBT3_9RHOB|nr:hypothetical protein [Falsigemmobacter intermedius]RWY41454.1 hypothetical protein EP867_09735 [Falsigemmobacter intermedius]
MLLRAALFWGALAGSAQADLAVITSQAAGRLTFLQTADGSLLREVDLPGQPAAIAVSAAHVAVIAVGSRTLHLLDPAGREVARHVFSGAPFALAFDGQSGDLLVTDAIGAGAVHRLSVPDLKPLGQMSAAANPTGIDSDAVGWFVVAARDADLALIYPPGCRSCSPRSVSVGHHPFGVTLHEGRAYVSNVLSDDLSVIDLQSGTEIARIPTGARPYATTFSGGRGFVSNQYDASLTVFDAAGLKVIGEIETADYPEGLSTDSEGRVVVAAWFSDLVQIFDPNTLQMISESPVAEGPRAFGRFITLNPAP